jgi:predicted anti-sigma-YlaC factor YlaD
MHRLIRDHLEEVLARPNGSGPAGEHLAECTECRDEIAVMREQAAQLRELRAPAETDPHPGFYARVMERIESQGPGSIWNLFFESAFGRRIAFASMALAVLLGLFLVSSEQFGPSNEPIQIAGEDQPGAVLTPAAGTPDRDAVLVNLVTYREQ